MFTEKGITMEHSYTATGGNSDLGVMDRVKETAAAQLSSQKDRATDGLGSLADAVRKTSQPLRENKQDTIARYVEKTADQIEQFSTRLRERDLGDLVNDAQRFARRQPALFIGGAFAVGVLATRFLKSSSDNRSHSWQRDDSHYTPGTDRTRDLTPGSSSGTGYGGGSGYGGGGL
ncbi:hypothetical protein BH23ACI1_BH23ACI1_02920 [soil metagenome]